MNIQKFRNYYVIIQVLHIAKVLIFKKAGFDKEQDIFSFLSWL